MKKDLVLVKAGVEFITIDLIDKVHRLSEQYDNVAMGVYTDEAFERIFNRKPIKPYEERARLADSIKGVKFVYSINNEDSTQRQVEQPVFNRDTNPKSVDVGYIPGTYDLFHEGHLQHLLEGRGICNILIAGVNSDDLVRSNKGYSPYQDEEKRRTVLENLKFVDRVIIVHTNDKSQINEIVRQITGGKSISAIIMGSDLREKSNLDQNPEGIPIIYTERDPVKMANSWSTTALKKKMNEFLGDIIVVEVDAENVD